MGTFKFKRFDIVNERSSMKVNTDGVLLGAAVPLAASDRRILDVGTGTGTIALMVAQRMHDLGSRDFRIEGIDIDEASAEEAAANFLNSPWAEALSARHVSLDAFDPGEPLDLIVSNPPYFDDSLQAPEQRRNIARHTEVGGSLSYRDLAAFASENLADDGRLALILPADQEASMLRCMRSFSLFPDMVMRIRTTERKQPSRIIVNLGRERTATADSTLTIRDGENYSMEYLALTREFYLFA